MVIPSLLAHAAKGAWAILPEKLGELQTQFRSLGEQKAFFDDYDEPAPDQAEIPKLYQSWGGIAVIEINGVLGKNLDAFDKRYFGGVDYDDIAMAIDQAEADPEVGAILFHVRSPGGMVVGLAEIGERIAAIQKDTIAYSDFVCASAAYWIASQCSRIYCSHSSILGSIGVIAAFLEQTGWMEKMGLKVNLFTGGKWKATGSPYKPMTDEERAMLQARIDSSYAKFKAVVTSTRKLSDEQMQGQTFDGEQAVAGGLADGIFASLEDLIADLHVDSPAK